MSLRAGTPSGIPLSHTHDPALERGRLCVVIATTHQRDRGFAADVRAMVGLAHGSRA